MPRINPLSKPLAALALAALTLAACTRHENDRLRLGESATLPTFQVHPHTLAPAGPSISGLDRSNWRPTVLSVPVSGAAHPPAYAPSAFDLATLPRQRGEQPTAESALDLGEPDTGAEVLQTARTHALAVFDAVLLLPRMVLRPPTATDWSPATSYARAPAAVVASPCCRDDSEDCCQAPTPCDETAPDDEPGDDGSPTE